MAATPGEPPGSREGWRKVRSGLTLLLIANYLLLGGAGVVLLGLLLISAGAEGSLSRSDALEVGILPFLVLYWVIGLAATVLQTTAYGFCMMVQPGKGSAAKPLAITAFALTAAGGVLYLLGILIRLRRGLYAALVGGEFGLLANIIWLAAFIVFLFFLRSAAVAIGEKRLARHLVSLLITGVSGNTADSGAG